MDAHRTVQGTATISATMRGLCGAAVTTHIRSCGPTKLLPHAKGKSTQGFKPLGSPVNGQNRRCPAYTASNDELIPCGVKLVKKGSLAKEGGACILKFGTCRQCRRDRIGHQRYEPQYDTGSGD